MFHFHTRAAVVAALLCAALGGGCAGPGALSRGMASDSGSGDSSAGSGQSSGASGESSAGSGASSGDSSESTNGSNESSNASSGSTGEESTAQSSAESSGESSRGTTDGTAAGATNVVVVLVPVSSTTTLAATTAGIFALVWSQQNPRRPQAEAAAYVYLKSIRHRLEEDLALGAGQSLEDLAELAGIRREHLSHFTRMLQRNRVELRALLEAKSLTPARAAVALRRIGEWAEADPQLVEDARGARAALAEAR